MRVYSTAAFAVEENSGRCYRTLCSRVSTTDQVDISNVDLKNSIEFNKVKNCQN